MPLLLQYLVIQVWATPWVIANEAQKIKDILRVADLFYSTEMLRYNRNAQYKTITGGVVSLILIVAFVIGFWSMITNTVNKTTVTSEF